MAITKITGASIAADSIDGTKIADDAINSGAVGDAFRWVQTSYNDNFRKNFAGVGDTYDSTKDAFYKPQPYPSWVLNESTCIWEAPVAKPDDGKMYNWDEATTNWVEIT